MICLSVLQGCTNLWGTPCYFTNCSSFSNCMYIVVVFLPVRTILKIMWFTTLPTFYWFFLGSFFVIKSCWFCIFIIRWVIRLIISVVISLKPFCNVLIEKLSFFSSWIKPFNFLSLPVFSIFISGFILFKT
jgi:hypothetical protein